ncbi:LamG-like jellyroll fold domain-containing protein [Streptomyces parvulus]|uniref:LamG-like jellyroll fold domain-containing protein n=1 Tax=Streptomyces parvulus TaxID=146923 RepID=UPI0033ED15FA
MPLIVEMGWGGLVQYPSTITWTDISRRVDMGRGVTITRGASDERSETQPGTATLRLDNQDGGLTPGNPGSPYWPYVRRGAPIRISVALIPKRSGAAPWPLEYLADDFDDNTRDTVLWSGNYGGATETGGAARVPVIPGGYAAYKSGRSWTLAGSQYSVRLATLPAAGGSSDASVSVMATSTTDGTRIGWTYNPVAGTLRPVSEVGYYDASAPTLTFSAINHRWLRIRESGGTFYWETSSDGFGWTVRRTLATPAWVTSQAVILEMVASRTGGVQDYVDFDLAGAIVRPRFYGMVNEFPVDFEGLTSYVSITCTDLFKRLNKLAALRSMLAQEILAQAPMVYYPLTEADDATSAGDIGGNAAPALAITQQGSGGTLAMSAAPGPTETGEQVPLFTPSSATQGKWLTVDLGPQFEDPPMYQYLCFEAWFQTTTTGRCILGVHTLDRSDQHLLSIAAGGGLQIEWAMEGGPLTTEPVSGPTTMADGNWHHVVYDQREGKVWVDGALVDSGLAVSRRWGERVVHVGGYRGTRLWSGSIAHVAIHSTLSVSAGPTAVGHWTAGTTGYAGEPADERVQRLAGYAGLPSVTVWGSTHDPIASQGPGGSSVVARLREVESTESGRLFAERDWYGLAYQSRDLRYNPDPMYETFTIAYADVEPGTSIRDDDQKLVNVVDAGRPGGANQRVTAPASVLAFGEYEQPLSLLKTSDNSVLDAAYWLVSRYANPGPELREVPIEAYSLPNYLDILDADISTYFSVTDLPAQAPALWLRVTVEGYTETIKEGSHLLAFHTSATATDSVWVLDDPTYSVLDSTTRLAY